MTTAIIPPLPTPTQSIHLDELSDAEKKQLETLARKTVATANFNGGERRLSPWEKDIRLGRRPSFGNHNLQPRP